MVSKHDFAEQAADDAPKSTLGRRLLVSVAVLFVLSLIVSGIASWYSFQSQKDKTTVQEKKADSGQTLAVQLQSVCDNKNRKRKYPELSNVCDSADLVAKGQLIPGPPGPAGPQGPAPSAQQVENAVTTYCNIYSCAKGPTSSQVATAVSRYCDNNGRCKGPSGDDGATGVQGPAPSTQQVVDAVAIYCTNQTCKGDTGDTGPNGNDGSDAHATKVEINESCDPTLHITPIIGVTSKVDGNVVTITCHRL